ncbi:hypothetical protein GRI97_05150 [Altererythrobacter xixiisoli]|uniref:Cytochrome c domain-containing protein n=1 Tax=Croceibacterium xixiisoli TaxID=1476466 RepID=A0A6I4TTC3_9SPHN|nr:hypothetical protein [Croceibacterium xixiisoli]MXO98371.1 hypothetical protein [Croceibacterium xixiisoli]
MVRSYLGVLAAVSLLTACGDNSSAVAQPDVTVQQLMAKTVQPTAEIYWGAVQYISDETGNHDIVPETDEDWEKTRLAAVKIGELGKQLASPSYAAGRGEDWVLFANSLTEVSKRAEQAAIDKDVEKTFEVGGTVYSVCSACHQVYPPKEADVPVINDIEAVKAAVEEHQ